jgi:hypothetical protein
LLIALADEYEKNDLVRVIEIDPDPEKILRIRSEIKDGGITESVVFRTLTD